MQDLFYIFNPMLRLREKFEAIAANLAVDVVFNYANRAEANAAAHTQPLESMPLINLVEIESGVFSLNPVTDSFKERYPQTAVQFLALSKFDYNSKENDAIVDQMKKLAKEFLLRYNATDYFEPLNDVSFNQLYHTYDEQTAGIEVIINVRELNSQSVCI